MNISMNTMNTSIPQISKMNTAYSNSSLSRAFQNQSSSRDEMNISSEGKAMGKMLRNDQTREQRDAHKVAFQSTYSELDIESLDTENMTDEELTEVLSAFENSMLGHMQEGYKPATEMNSSELKNTVNNIQGMNERMSAPKGQYGPSKGQNGPPGGAEGPKGPPPGGRAGPPPGGGKGPKGTESVGVEMLEALETDEDEEDDLLSTLIEALELEDTTNLYSTQSMEEILELINQTGNTL